MKENARELFVRIAAVLLSMILLCGLSACSSDKFYYADKPDQAKSITDTFGNPRWVELRSDGSEKIVYLVPDPMGGNYYHRYFIVKDGKVIGGGIE